MQPGEVRIKRALLSVSNKTGVVDFARGLADLGVELVSTGGTAAALREGGLEVRSIEDFTGFPEIMGGRVKTLHPKLYGGLLALRDDEEHMAAAAEHEVEFIDLVCVNLYPFEATARRRGATDHEVIENIDIGGPTMIRAAAKNFAFAAVVVNPASYDAVLQELTDTGGKLSLGTRESLAAEAFSYTARYDSAISRWFVEKQDDFPQLLLTAFEKVTDLSYGENPHQRAAFYQQTGARMHVLSMVRQLGGKELSFNNVLDLNAAPPARRRSSSCRRARSSSTTTRAAWPSAGRSLEAYHAAFACDPHVGLRRRHLRQPHASTHGFAEALLQQFCEVIIAPEFTEEALAAAVRQAEHARPGGRRAPAAEHRRARPQARHGRPARAGPRHGPRGPHGDGGRDRPQAVRGRSGARCCSPGRCASTCARTRSCCPTTSPRWASARAR